MILYTSFEQLPVVGWQSDCQANKRQREREEERETAFRELKPKLPTHFTASNRAKVDGLYE